MCTVRTGSGEKQKSKIEGLSVSLYHGLSSSFVCLFVCLFVCFGQVTAEAEGWELRTAAGLGVTCLIQMGVVGLQCGFRSDVTMVEARRNRGVVRAARMEMEVGMWAPRGARWGEKLVSKAQTERDKKKKN
jgi:hypothetical protein